MTQLICLALAAGGAGLGLYHWVRARRTVRRLERMVSEAIDGSFRENRFDESAVSALESKMARFLNGSAASTRQLEREHAAVQALISDISHQTRTPIANILLYASLLAEGELTGEQRGQVQTLALQAEKLSFLTGALVKTSRLEAGILAVTPRLQPLAALIEPVLRQAAAPAQAKGVRLAAQPAEGSARFDAKWTAEALYNVVDNAIKYTPVGGQVTIRAHLYELFCRVEVEDTGMGIPEAEQARIFGRFYRGEPVRDREGVGIGLYLTREILQRQGGYIRVDSQPGKGSRFSLYLPRV